MLPANRFPSFCLLVLSGVVLSCVGCGGGSNRQPVFPVQGKILVDGKAATNAVVVFHPEGQKGTDVLRPSGTVDADGNFQLTTYTSNDGAPAGKFAVTVLWRTPAKSRDDPELDRLPRRYLHPTTSKLSAEVKEGPTEVPTFNLSTR